MIAHVDADSFFASVLVRKHPKLKGKPVLALGMGGGCVIAASYEAKALGVKTGMRLTEALQLVPNAVRMPSDFRETGLASKQIESVLNEYCPFIEQMSVDEWYMDVKSCVGGQPTNLQGWATDVRLTVLKRTGISVSVGIAPSKLLAKMASEYRKPGGITIIDGDNDQRTDLSIESFLRDRPAEAIPGIGRQRSVHTQVHGWRTAFDIATADNDMLKELFGRPGIDMQRELKGESISPIVVNRAPPKSISRCRSFRKTTDTLFLQAQVLRHLEYAVLKMRRQHLACRGVSVWVRDDRYEHCSHNRTLPQPLQTEEQIRPYVESCFQSMYEKGMTCTQTGLALWNLVPSGAQQCSLFEDSASSLRDEKVQQALDALHERFGRDAITHGSALAVKSGTRRGFGTSEVG